MWLESLSVWSEDSAMWLEGLVLRLEDAAVRCARGVEWKSWKAVKGGITAGGINSGDIKRQPK